jgi:hypothetical protein
MEIYAEVFEKKNFNIGMCQIWRVFLITLARIRSIVRCKLTVQMCELYNGKQCRECVFENGS